MLSRTTQKYKVISTNDAFEFETRLNSFLKSLDEKGIEYEVQTNPTAGLLAFIIYRESIVIPEGLKEEYELAGERHYCIECPFYVRPTDGRVKNTRCGLSGKLTRRDDSCCDDFYKKMEKGEIELIEVEV